MTSTAFGNGEIRAAGSNAPVLLDDVERAWLVMGGAMDVFAVPVRDGSIVGPREFVFHVEPGELLLGCGIDADTDLTLMAVGGADGAVMPMSIDDVREYVQSHPAVGMELIDQYIRTVSSAFGVRSAPRLDVLADGDEALVLKSGGVIGSRREVVWLSLEHGAVQLLGEPGRLAHSHFRSRQAVGSKATVIWDLAQACHWFRKNRSLSASCCGRVSRVFSFGF